MAGVQREWISPSELGNPQLLSLILTPEFIFIGQISANYSQQAKSIYKVLLGQSYAHFVIYCLMVLATMSLSNSYNRDCMAHKA